MREDGYDLYRLGLVKPWRRTYESNYKTPDKNIPVTIRQTNVAPPITLDSLKQELYGGPKVYYYILVNTFCEISEKDVESLFEYWRNTYRKAIKNMSIKTVRSSEENKTEILLSVEVHPYANHYFNNVSSLYSDLNRIVRGSILSLIDRKSPK